MFKMFYAPVIAFVLLAFLHGVSATTYSLTIKMDPISLTRMKEEGFNLYVFKGVKAKITVSPTVWFADHNFLESTTATWTENYKSYISKKEFKAGAIISSITSASMNAGQLASIDATGYGTLTVTNNPSIPSNTYGILNQATQSFTVGLSQVNNGIESTICAASLYGNDLANIIPIERVFVMFATEWHNTGTVLTQTTSSGMLIDMTEHTSVTINYDYNKAWDAGGASYTQIIPPLTDFASFLNK